MAYDKELFNIVDLIDILDPSTDPKIVKYLCERYLRENFKEEKPEDESKLLYENRLASDFVAANAEMPSIVITENEPKRKLDLESELIEQNLHLEADEVRPSSTISNFLRADIPLRKSSMSTESIVSDQPLVDPLRTDKQIVDELNASLVQKLKEKLESVNNALRDALNQSRMSNHNYDVKCFKYSGYKVNLELKKTNELLPPILCSRLDNHVIKPSKEVIHLETQNDIEIKKVFKPNETASLIDDLDETNKNQAKKVNSNETTLPSLWRNVKPVIKSDLIVFQYEEDQKYYFKNKTTEDTFETNDTKYAKQTWDKHLPKIKNFYYMNSLKRIPAARDILIDSLNKYSEPLFPMLQASATNQIESNSLDKPPAKKPKKVIFSEENNASVKRRLEEMPNFPYNKTDSQINEQYLKSLKKSGLINKNCKPVVRSSSLKINFKYLNF